MAVINFYSAIHGVITRHWQSVCLLCQNKSQAAYDLCGACESQLTFNNNACPVCAMPLISGGLCDCDRLAAHLDACFAPLLYQDKVSDMIHRFKYRGQRRYGRLLSGLMTEFLMRSDIVDWPEVLVPVPTHWRRRFHRGFNPTEDLANDLSRQFSIPVATNVIAKRNGIQLSKLDSRRLRFELAESSYYLKKPYLKSKITRVAIIDDVLTSGATAVGLAQLLRGIGIEQVQVWACARTVVEKNIKKNWRVY